MNKKQYSSEYTNTICSIMESYSKKVSLKNMIHTIDDTIRADALKILKNLMEIDGWESLIKDCKAHYERTKRMNNNTPDVFFGWCHPEVYGAPETPKLCFEKSYTDGSNHIVLCIDLLRPLDEQVDEAVENEKRRKEKENKDENLREWYEYVRLKKKFENKQED